MLTIQKDESIHSFIYRVHVVNGVSDFSNIITAKGGWASFPKILKNTLHLYEPIDDCKFLHLLRDIGLARITDKTFSDPVMYRSDLEDFFGKNQETRTFKQRTLQISYCLECVKSQIKKCGYGVIKVTWLGNSWCPIHKTDLYIVRTTNRNEAIKALGNVYRGIHPESYGAPKYRSEHYYDSRKHKLIKERDYIAACLKNDLEEFIKANWKNFPKGLLDKNYTSESYLTKPYMMNKIYETAKNSKYKKFKVFWSRYAETKLIFTGVVNRESIKEKMYKSTKTTCQNCKHLYCFSNLAIIPTRQDDRLVKRCELNRMLITDYLKSMGGVNYRVREKLVSEMSYKQKKDVLSRYKGNLFHQHYKIALDNTKYACAVPYLRWPKE